MHMVILAVSVLTDGGSAKVGEDSYPVGKYLGVTEHKWFLAWITFYLASNVWQNFHVEDATRDHDISDISKTDMDEEGQVYGWPFSVVRTLLE